MSLLACFRLGWLFSSRAATMPQTFNFCRLRSRFRGCSRSCLSLRFTHLSGSSRRSHYRAANRRTIWGCWGAFRARRGRPRWAPTTPVRPPRCGKTVRYTCLCHRGAGSAIKKTPWAKNRWPVLVSRLSYVASMSQTSISAMKKPRCSFDCNGAETFLAWLDVGLFRSAARVIVGHVAIDIERDGRAGIHCGVCGAHGVYLTHQVR